jgi:hypothetical protein
MKDQKLIHTQLSSKIHHALKLYTLNNNTTMASVLTELLTRFLQDKGYLDSASHTSTNNPVPGSNSHDKPNFEDISF